MFSKSAKKQKFGEVSQSALNRTNDLVAQTTRVRGGAGIASMGFASAPSFRQGTVAARAATTGDDGIPALDGSTLGSADVTEIFFEQDDSGNVTIVDDSGTSGTTGGTGSSGSGTGGGGGGGSGGGGGTMMPAGAITFTAYNLSSQEVQPNTKIICAKVGGVWMCIWEDCPSS